MRTFGAPAQTGLRNDIMTLARSIYDEVEPKRTVKAADFAMEESPEEVVVREVDLRNGPERLRVAMTDPAARPPFEWLLEITSDIGEADYFKHYLVREHDVVLAQRKELTPVDDQEAATILSDLRTAKSWLQ